MTAHGPTCGPMCQWCMFPWTVRPPKPPEWETIVRARLDATHERSQREAWLLGQLVEARRQLEAGIDRLRAIEERLSP